MHSERILVGVLVFNTFLIIILFGWLYMRQTQIAQQVPQAATLPAEHTPGTATTEPKNGDALPATGEPTGVQTLDTADKNTPTIAGATYTDAVAGFSFEVPSTITSPKVPNHLTDEQRTSMNIVQKVELIDKKTKAEWDKRPGFVGDGGPDRVVITVYENPENLDLKPWLIDQADIVYTNYENQTLSPATIDGEPGFIYLVEGLGSIDYAVVKHPTNNRIYLFSAQLISAQPQARQDFWAILGSFSF